MLAPVGTPHTPLRIDSFPQHNSPTTDTALWGGTATPHAAGSPELQMHAEHLTQCAPNSTFVSLGRGGASRIPSEDLPEDPPSETYASSVLSDRLQPHRFNPQTLDEKQVHHDGVEPKGPTFTHTRNRTI